MALVAYDNSDSSDYEDEESTIVAAVPKSDRPPISDTAPQSTVEIIDEDETLHGASESNGDGPNLFNLLPQPSKKKTAVIEEDDEFLHKKEKADIVKPKAKITVPSLKDFKDVDSPGPVKAKAPSTKKSGLLSILPQPKNGFTKSSTKSLVPHVLTQKNNASIKKKPDPPPAKKTKKLLNEYSDDSDNDEDVQNDFFSIHKRVELPIVDEPLDIDESPQEKTPAVPQRSKLESYFKQDPVESQVDLQPPSEESYEDYSSEAGSSYSHDIPEGEGTGNGDIEIDQEALMKLCGSRSKRHREDIQMVDVNQKDLLADAREWLLKGLMDDSSKRMSSSKKKGNEPTSQQKRKHQITFLAHQAKANEAELQNQWANSRMSRRQTQNKYGF